jgi:hypothetical protein
MPNRCQRGQRTVHLHELAATSSTLTLRRAEVLTDRVRRAKARDDGTFEARGDAVIPGEVEPAAMGAPVEPDSA